MKISDITGALRAYKAATRLETVSDMVATERANVCLRCPQRKKTTGISRISRFLSELARQHNVDKNISNFSCGICSCNLQLLLSALPENLHKDSPEQKAKRAKTKCWMNGL